MLRYKTETRPGLVALYDIRPGNGAGPFLQPGARTGRSVGGARTGRSVGGRRCKRQHFRVFMVPFDYPAHGLQETVLPQTNGTDGKPRL